MKDLNVSALLDVYGEFLSEKQRLLTEYYYNDDLSLSEIAENEGITRQGVNDLIKRAVIQLKCFEEKCGYCKSFSRLKQIGDQIKSDNDPVLEEMVDIINEL